MFQWPTCKWMMEKQLETKPHMWTVWQLFKSACFPPCKEVNKWFKNASDMHRCLLVDVLLWLFCLGFENIFSVRSRWSSYIVTLLRTLGGAQCQTIKLHRSTYLAFDMITSHMVSSHVNFFDITCTCVVPPSPQKNPPT